MNAKFADVHNYLGVALVENDQVEEGEAALRACLEINPDYMVAHINLGFTLARLGKPRQAEEQLRAVLEKEPTNQAVLSLLEELGTDESERRKPGEDAVRHDQ